MTPPTARQLEIYEFMRKFNRQTGIWPTVREICDEFDFASTNGANDHLLAMQRKGLVRHRPGCARGWIAVELDAQEPNHG